MLGVRDDRFDALCSALDSIQGQQGLMAFALKVGLSHCPTDDSNVEIWKGTSEGACIEIVVLAPAGSTGEWTLSTLVTAAGRVEHLRRRAFAMG